MHHFPPSRRSRKSASPLLALSISLAHQKKLGHFGNHPHSLPLYNPTRHRLSLHYKLTFSIQPSRPPPTRRHSIPNTNHRRLVPLPTHFSDEHPSRSTPPRNISRPPNRSRVEALGLKQPTLKHNRHSNLYLPLLRCLYNYSNTVLRDTTHTANTGGVCSCSRLQEPLQHLDRSRSSSTFEDHPASPC